MAGSFKTTTKDKGYTAILHTFKEVAGKPSVAIGVLEDSGDHGDGLSVAEVATFNEFGTETIPERSFIRSTVDQNFNNYLERSRKLQSKVILQELSVKEALSVLGESIQSDIIKTINAGVDPENDPKTIERKGSSTPLIDTGQLKQSIRYKVDGT